MWPGRLWPSAQKMGVGWAVFSMVREYAEFQYTQPVGGGGGSMRNRQVDGAMGNVGRQGKTIR